MPNLAGSQLPIPENWNEFEEICADLFELTWGSQTTRYGRGGQRQNGIDIHGRPAKGKNSAVQCKGKKQWPPNPMTVGQIKEIVEEAKKFKPKLNELFIATTAPDDTALSDCANKITDAHAKKGLFSVTILGWGELDRRLTRFPQLIEKHFDFLSLGAIKTSVEEVKAQASQMAADLPGMIQAAIAPALPSVTDMVAQGEIKEPIERDLEARYQRALKRQPYPEVAKVDELASLAGEVLEPRNAHLSEALRRKILLRASRASSVRGNVANADRYLAEAKRLKSDERNNIAEARIFAARGDADKAIRHLRDSNDQDARSVLLNIVATSKSDEEALAWCKADKIAARDLTGSGVSDLCRIHLRRQDWDNATKAAEAAGEEQLREYPLLRFFRGAIHLGSAMAKDVRPLVFGGVPVDVRVARVVVAKDQARKLLGSALEDFTALAMIMGELELGREKRLVESFRSWCKLLHPDFSVDAKSALQVEMLQPRNAVENLPFAFAYLKDFDPADLSIYLQNREQLGGLDDDELRARFRCASIAPRPAKWCGSSVSTETV